MPTSYVLPILQNGDPRLREVVKPLPEELFGSDELKIMLKQLGETLDREADGVGLAGPQIGIMYRMFVARIDRTIHKEKDAPKTEETATPMEPQLAVFINPQFVKSSRRREDMDEGCLSVRGVYGTTLRHTRATIRARDENGKAFERGAGGLLAHIFQHEVDHLNGILFIDHAHSFIEIQKRNDQDIEVKIDEETASRPHDKNVAGVRSVTE